jgi:aspartoacylase
LPSPPPAQRTAGHFATVFIVGGTHGNERTGVSLIRHWRQDASAVARESFATRLLLANPEAVEADTRFIDRDLNRSFGPLPSGANASEGCESVRARDIAQRIAGTRVDGKVFALDLHTTTANMGTTLITDTDPANLDLAAQVKARDPSIHIYAFPPGDRIDSCLRAAADGGLGLEIGPIPQSVVRHAALLVAVRCVGLILDVLDAHNRGILPPPDPATPIYLHETHQYYPGTADDAQAVFVHRDLEGRDYRRLVPGAPMFGRLNGAPVAYEGPSERYPVFINEAAYYRERIAFSLTRRTTLGRLGTSAG